MEPLLRSDIAVITGGHLKDHSPYNAWLPELKEVEGVHFLKVDRCDRRFYKYVDGNFSMLDEILKKRNEEVQLRMDAACRDEDPMADDEATPQKRPRRTLADELPSMISVAVTSEQSGNHSVRVLSDWYKCSKLFIELTQVSIKLLLEEPQADDDRFTPIIREMNVKWAPSNRLLYTRIQIEGKWKTKSKRISARDPDRMQAQVVKHAKRLQQWHDHRGESAEDAVSGEQEDTPGDDAIDILGVASEDQ